MVGTGASAVQIVPEIQPLVDRLVVFQRTGNWFLPRRNRPYPAALRRVFEHVPGVQALRRRYIYQYTESLTVMIRHPRTLGWVGRLWSTAFMRAQLRDPEVRRKAWPDFAFGCKRILFSSKYLPALQQPNVDLVTDPIAGMAEDGVITSDGTLHPVDCVIWGTGFRTNDFMFPMEVTGAGGPFAARRVVGGRARAPGDRRARLPVAVSHVRTRTRTPRAARSSSTSRRRPATCARRLSRSATAAASAIAVKPEVEAAVRPRAAGSLPGTAWTACDSWYRDDSGRIVANWPGYMREYEAATARLDPAEYELVE
jgi:cation diffusion facilitator CzcD-associated flavoprotein CzcO